MTARAPRALRELAERVSVDVDPSRCVLHAVTAALALVLMLHASFAWAGCTRGCPCGNSCISCADTCHIGGGGGGGGSSGGSSGGGAGISSTTGGLILLSVGVLGGLGAVLSYQRIEPACANVSSGEMCGPAFAWWVLTIASAGFMLAGIVLVSSGDSTSSSQALSVPLMSGTF